MCRILNPFFEAGTKVSVTHRPEGGERKEGGRQWTLLNTCLCTGYAVYAHYFVSGVIIILLFT